jgi:hypothetical protein
MSQRNGPSDSSSQEQPASPVTPPLTCPTCFQVMDYWGESTIVELGVDVQSRIWKCENEHWAEQQWLATA